MFLFLLLTELFSLKPAQRQPQSQEGHKMQVFKPGKQAMLELFWKPGFFPVLFFQSWTLELSRWLKENSWGHYKEPKAETWDQHHASNFFICPSKTRFWIFLLNFLSEVFNAWGSNGPGLEKVVFGGLPNTLKDNTLASNWIGKWKQRWSTARHPV